MSIGRNSGLMSRWPGRQRASDAVPLLEDRHQVGRTLAYLCEGFVCDLPTSDADELVGMLNI